MIELRTACLALLALGSLQGGHAEAHAAANEKAAIEAVLGKYQAALNASSAAEVLPLYDDGGVFMQPDAPSAIGREAIRKTYEADFKDFTLTVKFHPIEIVLTGADWAFARTSSSGTQTIRATGAKLAEANQELFIFHKANGAWLIARYAFSTTNPPAPR